MVADDYSVEDKHTPEMGTTGTSVQLQTSHHGSRRGSRGSRRATLRSPPREIDDDIDDSDNSSDVARRMQGFEKPGLNGRDGGGGGNRHPRGRSARIDNHEVDDGNMSDISGMVVLHGARRDGLGGGGSGRSGGHLGNPSSRGIGSSGHGFGASSHNIGVNVSGGLIGGKEPAVKGCGCMTSATFMKLVRRFSFWSFSSP